MADGHLIFDTKIDKSGFKNGLSSIGNGLDRLKSELKSVAAAVGLAFGARELVRFGKTAVETAAAVNAANSAMAQTFGALEDAAVSAMQRVADESGIMRTRLQGAGTQIYAFAKASGMDSVQALSMMEDALRTAADSAAYYDRSLEETTESLKSFLKGNFANDAALGVSCTETTRNMAANKLYAKSYRDLSEAQKQLTLLQMVKDANALSGAEGQAAREAEGWENVIGNLKEAWRQLLAVIGQPGLSVAVSVVQQLTAWLTALTSAAERAIATISEIAGFEVQAEQTAAVKSNITQSVAEQEALTDAVRETEKEQRKSLTSYDEIHQLAEETAADTGAGAVIPVKAAPVADIRRTDKAASKISQRLKKMLEPVKLAWDAEGGSTLESFARTWKNIRDLVGAVRKSYADVWTNGTGQRSLESSLRLVQNVSGAFGTLAGQIRKAWEENETGTKIVQALADTWINLKDTAGNFWGWVSDSVSKTDFTPLLTSFSKVADAFRTITDPEEGLGNDLKWVYDNILEPFGQWTLEEAIPTVLTALSNALDGLHKIWEKVRGPLRKLYDDFIRPLAELAGDAALKLIEGLGDALQAIGDSMTDKKAEVLVKVAAAVASIAASAKLIGKGAALVGGIKAATAGAGGLGAMLTSSVGAVGLPKSLIAGAGALIGGYTLGDILLNDVLGLDQYTEKFGEWFYDFVHGADTSEWSKFWEEVGGVVADGVSYWESGIKSIGDWFSGLFSAEDAEQNIAQIDSVTGAVRELGCETSDVQEIETSFFDDWAEGWKSIGETASGTWEGVKKKLSDGWEGLKGKVNDYGDAWKSGWESIKQKASQKWSDLKSDLSLGWGTIKGKVSDYADSWVSGWKTIKEETGSKWEEIKSKITESEAWQAITGKVSEWKSVWMLGFDEIQKHISDFADAVGRIFGRIWSGTDGKGGIKAVVNVILGGIEWMLNGIVAAANKVIGFLNSISIETPEWLPFDWGGKKIGFDLKTFSDVKLPRLATGTVVPANFGEFAAILGDNRREPEIVSPVSAMKRAFTEALAEMHGGTQTQVIQLVCDGRKLAETVRKYNIGMSRVTNGGTR